MKTLLRELPSRLFFLLVLSLSGTWVWAQDDEFSEEIETVQVRLPETALFPGQVFPFYLVIEDAETVSAGDLPESEDFSIRYVDAVSTVTDGVKNWALTYQAVPIRGGRLTLPAIPVTVDGIDLWNAPKSVKVEVPKATEEMELKVTLSKRQCYVGEALLLRFEWESRLSLNGVRALQIRVPALRDPQIQTFAPVGIDPKAPGTIGLPVAGRRIIGKFSESTIDEKPVSRIVFERIIVPKEPGNFRIPASTLLCSYFEPKEWKFRGSRYPSYFNNDFFDHDSRGEYDRLISLSAPLPLQVLPLPREGRPPGFAGSVGSFSVSAEAEPKVVEVLEPVTLRLAFKGHPFPQTLEIPALGEQRPLAATFRVPQDQGLPKVEKGVQRMVQTVRPIHDGVAAVPALHFDYFDPETGRYGSTTTKPIPITVKASRAATAFEAEFSDGTALKNEVIAGDPGLRHNRMGSTLLATTPLASSQGSSLFWVLALGLPPLLCILGLHGLSLRNEQRLHPDRVRARKAYAVFRRDSKAAQAVGDPEALRCLVENYLCDRLGWKRGAASPSELRESAGLAGGNEQDVDEIHAFLESRDWATFGFEEDGHEAEDSSARLLEVVAELEKNFSKNGSPPPMKAPVLLLLILWLLPSFDAEARAESNLDSEVLKQAESLFAEANEVSLSDPARGKDLFAESAAHFEALLAKNHSNPALHTNLANARFLQGDLGKSILHYHRALLHDPSDPLAQEGLAHARSRRVDSFPTDNTSWRGYLAGFCEKIGTRRLRWGMIAGWLVLWLGLFLLKARGGVLPARLVLSGLGVFLLLGLTFLLWSRHEKNRPLHVIVVPETLVRKGDGYLYDPAFPNPVHSGAEFRELEKRGGWIHAEFPNEESGWIPEADCAAILPK